MPAKLPLRAKAISERALDWAEELADDLVEQLWLAADLLSRRRGSQTIDESDVDAAHRQITRPRREGVIRNLLVTLLLLAAAVPVGLSVNWLSADLGDGVAWLVLGLAVTVAVLAELFRHFGADR